LPELLPEVEVLPAALLTLFERLLLLLPPLLCNELPLLPLLPALEVALLPFIEEDDISLPVYPVASL